MAFDDDTALQPVSEGVWEGAIADGWATPRGPLGGYVMAIVVRAMELAVDDAERTARSATMHFLRVPELGPVTVRAVVERQGRSLTTVSARLEQDDKLLGIAVGAWSKPWPGPVLDTEAMPDAAPPEGRPPRSADFPRRQPPAFMQKLSMQHRFGDPPFSNADRGEAGGWVGLLEERPIDAPAVAVFADAWFPAPWPRLGTLVPAPTIDLTVHFRVSLPLDDSLLLGRFRNSLVRDGFFDEDGELWLPDGTLVAQSRQLGLLIGMA
jgi:acyl-CoA thioesterase